jgi:hypothetical protein|tara:strand:+ start:407 stop:751 length:345 start_codon:yes stop_codon:yes gene_type:complete
MTSKIEAHNLKEEIEEITNKALKQGIPNHKCAVFRILREDQFSPKGKATLLNNNHHENLIFDCNLCKACEQQTNLCQAFQKARQLLALKNKEPKANKEILENMKKTGNVYGIRN